jgi:ribosomal protein L16 Arg81 hydroxylase
MTPLTPSLDMTTQDWTTHGGRTPIEFTHRLVDEPLLTLEALAELADRLDDDQIEITSAAADVVVERRVTERLRRVDGQVVAADLVLHAERDGRWMAMRHVESVPAYRRLVDGLFGEFCALAGIERGLAYRPEGYVFIGATGAVTPAHVDHEHNLFFQVRGTKRFTTGEFPDDEQEHRTFEGMYADEYGSTNFAPANAVTHVLVPGDGLYVPPPAVHLVENDDSLAISFSLVFHDRVLDRTAKVYAFNSHVRGLGITPRPPGRLAIVDQSKAAIVEGWRRARVTADRTRNARSTPAR